MLVVLLAAAAHNDQVTSVRHDGRARPALGRADQETAGRAQAEHRDYRIVEPVRRPVGVPAGPVVVVAVPVHPQPGVRAPVMRPENPGQVGQFRLRRVGDDRVLGGQPRLFHHSGVHPARALLPVRLVHEQLHERGLVGQPARDVVNPRRLVELNPGGGRERLVGDKRPAHGPRVAGRRLADCLEKGLLSDGHGPSCR